MRAVFMPGADGKPVLLDNGVWRGGGCHRLMAGLSWAGTLHIKPASATERRFILDGELVRKQ